MPTPSKRLRPTPRGEEPPRVRVTRGSSQNNTDRHHPPRGSHNVRPFDQDTLEREASNNDVMEEVEVDVIDIDDNDAIVFKIESHNDDDGARFLPQSENQHQSRTEELNVHGNNGHIDIDFDNDNVNDDADEDIGEENNDDDDDDEVEEEEEESNDEEMEESNVLREPRPTHTHNTGDDDDDNAGDDDHHHVSDNNNNAEDNEGRQQAEDRNSWLNFLAMNLVRVEGSILLVTI